MATLTQLYTRIILDTNRDDMGSGGELEQAKIDAVTDAIEGYAGELFWFNRKSGTAATVANTATVAQPTGMRVPQVISYLGAPLTKVALWDIWDIYNAATPVTGQPTWWAEDEGLIRLYPTPDAVYTLNVYGIADIGFPATTNEWTTEAYNLILNEAKIILCAGPLRDPDGLALAKDRRNEALSRLRRETIQRVRTDRSTELGSGQAFNINTG